MKGLLTKDFLVILKQMKLFLILIVMFIMLPNFSSGTFAIVYAAMMPITIIAYDERSKWDKLAAMMPYSAKEIVLSKYILGFTMIFATALLMLAADAVSGGFANAAAAKSTVSQILLVTCMALVFEAVNIPVMIKIGVEKGRILFIAFIAIAVTAGVILLPELSDWKSFGGLELSDILLAAVLITAGLCAISMITAVKLYEGKME